MSKTVVFYIRFITVAVGLMAGVIPFQQAQASKGNTPNSLNVITHATDS